LRSKTSIRTSPKKAFVDPSIGIAALGSAQTDYGIERLRKMRDLIKAKNVDAGRVVIKEPDFYKVF